MPSNSYLYSRDPWIVFVRNVRFCVFKSGCKHPRSHVLAKFYIDTCVGYSCLTRQIIEGPIDIILQKYQFMCILPPSTGHYTKIKRRWGAMTNKKWWKFWKGCIAGDTISKAMFLSLRQISYTPCLQRRPEYQRIPWQPWISLKRTTVGVVNNCHLKWIYEEHENVIKNRNQDHNNFTTKHW